MRKPNYSWEKRQRELAKQKKKEEKRNKKLAAKDMEADPVSPETGDNTPVESDDSQD